MGRKPDADEIANFMRGLADSLKLGDARRLWPMWLFHTTDAENLFGILDEGELKGRAEVLRSGRVVRDTANQEIINRTQDEYRNCARLYFRPRTPSQYQTEEFRSKGETSQPTKGISVVLVFNSISVLTMAPVKFTDGNAGSSRSRVGDDVAFLRSLPFDRVYHDVAFPPELREEIVWRRQAEVLVPGHLRLARNLTWIVLRSEAETETVIQTLREQDEVVLNRYRGIIRTNTLSSNSTQFFERRWTYVEQARVADGVLIFEFSDACMRSGAGTFAVGFKDWFCGSTTGFLPRSEGHQITTSIACHAAGHMPN